MNLMHTKKNCQSSLKMSSLSIFPVEILECITGAVATSEQMRLWRCGDRILNTKLKNGGLKRTSLCWSGPSWMPWPRSYFTTFSGIESVEWGMSTGTSLCPTLELNLLPLTLKHLSLACDDVFLLLRMQNVNLNELLPTLHSLELSGSRLCEESLKNLPSNLIELYVTSTDEKIVSSNLFGDLPRTIQKMKLSFMIKDESELENDLPSDLISLEIHGIQSKFNWFSKLPKSLISLRISHPSFDPDWDTLPPRLEVLILRRFYCKPTKSNLVRLPQSLKALELWQVGDLKPEDQLISLLPKSLTSFEYLTVIDHNDGLQQLPVSLTDFDVFVSATHPDILSFYHSETTSISITRGPWLGKLNLLPLPPKLQRFFIDYINDDICAILPSGLQKLTIYAGFITAKGASNFPKSLTSLTAYFDNFDNNQTMSYLGHIPNLHLMALEQPNQLCKVDEDWLSFLLPSSQTGFRTACVPSKADPDDCNLDLTSLSLSGRRPGRSSPFVTQSFFDSLPKFKNLTSLFILNCDGISSDCLALLPQKMTSLNITSLSTYPTANQLEKLPKGLTNLGIKGNETFCPWTDETLQSLPSSLQMLSVDGTFQNLTHRMCEYLPPNVKVSSIQDGNELTSSPLERLYGKKDAQ